MKLYYTSPKLVAMAALFALSACTGEEAAPFADANTPPVDGGIGGDGGLTDALIQPDIFPPLPDSGVVVCSAYDYRGETYNCEELDRCSEQNLLYRLACCECDPSYYCNPPPEEECCAADPNCCNEDAECREGEACQGNVCVTPPECDAANPCPEGQSCEDGACAIIGCGDGPPCDPGTPCVNGVCRAEVESCMRCHNGGQDNKYTGPGLSNPHAFPGAENIPCSGCHGGNPGGNGKLDSHVPAPPRIGDKINWANDPEAYFNRLTLAGIDKLEPPIYDNVNRPGEEFSNLDYLQFINPGDLRIVSEGRGCGAQGCHFNKHGQWMPRSPIATTTGLFSGTRFAVGVDNRMPEFNNLDEGTLADTAPRAIADPNYNPDNRVTGQVGRLVELPEKAAFNGPMRNNAIYDANTLANHIIDANEDPNAPNRVRTGSPLETLIDEQIAITCGNCHAGNAGANNRYADFRSSGCTSCHMQYSFDGRSRSSDPNVNKLEPVDPDNIAAPERPHIEAHQIRNVAKVLPNGGFIRGISDAACAGCHQGSNRTVLQYWGIRLDQNQDLTNNVQYPANPDNFTDAAADTRLYNPAANNNTFNGREAAQHILYEDYDADGRDDTPPDTHYESGMGCIDCHGSRDLHAGTDGDASSGMIASREDQVVKIECKSCHGGVGNFAPTAECTTYEGRPAQCATDAAGNVLRHVTKDPMGNYWLVSRLDGQRHYVPQTRDITVNTNRSNPLNGELLYNPKASYAMGAADGNPQTGVGPQQANPQLVSPGFSHTDNLDCASCHASWTNNCIGCHLATEYNVNPNEYFFSNITGERILLKEAVADFVYQSPVMMYMGINSRGRITQISPAEKTFYRYFDLNGNESAVFAFSDKNGDGNNPANAGRNAFPALAMSQMAPHSIRGAPTADMEGTRQCVTCHLNEDMLNNFGAEYAAFLDTYADNDFANLDFNLLQEHIGQNTGNQLNSPFFVHMVAGRGTGLFLFDETGCPVNPLDENANRQYCPDGAPADNFDANNVVYDMDRIVEFNGISNSSSTHPMLGPGGQLRAGSLNPWMAGPMDARRIQMMSDPNLGKILDSWIDADGNAQGNAADFIQ